MTPSKCLEDSTPDDDAASNEKGDRQILNPLRMAFSVKETAQILGISEKTVRRLIDRKLLHPSRALRHLLISKKEIEHFLQTTSG